MKARILELGLQWLAVLARMTGRREKGEPGREFEKIVTCHKGPKSVAKVCASVAFWSQSREHLKSKKTGGQSLVAEDCPCDCDLETPLGELANRQHRWKRNVHSQLKS